ncbi:small molecule-binding protein [Streptococcus mutans]|uniref:GyrI-like domain-containing protein n=1 Tax=Streptococcus mutans TaxID=1309 RepID=UPI00145558F0|nr:GyrI-like domain-containing protein [Streptococcus mutans]MDB8631628.1 GyrI-like domain-containing protein [Streptococcus mutans]MEE0813560.1 GyrI-like domain-containing protein [Streptococcus mutans]NLQ88016.1 small molecule-binding protein [Streptococcus mutans]
MKHEWRKFEKELYGVKAKPIFLEVEEQQFITIKGKGNPNDQDFSNRVSALYALAYGIKMAYKQAMKTEQDDRAVTDFAVYPLEGLWQQAEDVKEDTLEKDKLSYTIMIRQPEFITKELVAQALDRVKIKKPNSFYESISFESIKDGKCIQVLHIGSYDDEPQSFAKMDAFAKEHGLKRSSDIHREIYLSNTQRTEKSKLKTILRYQVEEK